MEQKPDWENLGFSYKQTNCFIRISYKNGTWQTPEILSDYMVPMHIAASCLHYGQSVFEGLKAFKQKDNTIACFRPQENAKRIAQSAQRLLMAPPPTKVFIEGITTLIRNNLDYIPPYGTGATFYIRPLLVGSDPRVGLQPSQNYDLYILGIPVGPYYKDGFFPVKAYIQTEYHRAAPLGTGHIKAAGNYAAAMLPSYEAKDKGYAISLYLNAENSSYIDEFGTSNFIGLTEDKRYLTPNSSSILNSITNRSLQQIARRLGYTIEKRKIKIDELASFTEVGACGTATVITPISSITCKKQVFTYGKSDAAGETLTALYHTLLGIQFGEQEDPDNWMYKII